MQEGLFLHVAASFAVGGAFIAGCSLAAERFGTEVGGIIAGLPSTIAITLLFVALTDSPGQAVEETTFTPAALGLNCLFFAAYALGAARGRVAALAAALVTWLVLAVGAVLLVPRRLPAAVALLAIGLALALWLLRLTVPPGEGEGTPVGPGLPQVLARALFGGVVIALGVWLSRTGGAVVGGVAAVFPAAGVSTLAIVSWSRGPRFSVGLLQPMMVSGALSIMVYAMVVRYAYPSLGVGAGTVAALIASGGSAYVLYRWRRRGRR